ncbi:MULTISPECIES: carboxymuconolactone decarboxylase family protein [unclassified Burkholderia]|uniref:carboxymuconolactone decarboxylase family protein n=1 Tax=unclassified Burkholderia TaxID=2613784 RepID=UPI00046A6EEA|nr:MULTISPECIES: carboxymuconolactone decarboxylase family protein [unclassified Burkholderia]NIE85995.1 carboxymuconolactone decarboxylase family protein [Burkholderia sp. Tr-860]NIF64671.1 carboxymuconolactone decarboxylase family protein [Burkholderia sp. Cy-647]NIF72965.1 carboxymuconolactone decarboxylase family protein [Burkholderia sp. Ap-962]NIF87737.1 carboxymuconolactone decarboxylase family protein [Burkholderia sp. Cy-637]NIF94976.1 carboxymuconolactone decarboxylase family protein
MSRILFPAVDTATGDTADAYAAVRKFAGGSLPNLFATLGHLAPASLKSVLQAETALAGGSLSRQELEAVKLAVSEFTGCDYCVAAHAMLGRLAGLAPDALRRIRAKEPTGNAKLDALLHFVELVMSTRGTLEPAAVETIRAAGYTEAQLADLSLAIGLTVFTNTFNRINDTDLDFPSK